MNRAVINGVVGRNDSNDDLRWYVDPSDPDVKWPSVTTFLGATHSLSHVLTPWGARSAAKFAIDSWQVINDKLRDKVAPEEIIKWVAAESERIRAIKSEIGIHQHNILEALIIDAPLPECPEHLIDVEVDGERVDQDAISDGLLNFFNDFAPEIEMAEATVASTTYGYAGTLDLAGWFPTVRIPGRATKGARIAIDLKTGAHPGETARNQIVLYKNADEVWLDALGNKAPMPVVDMCGVLHLRRSYKGGYKLTLVEPVDERALLDEGLYSLRTFDLTESNKKRQMKAFYPPLGDGSQPLPLIEDITAGGFGRHRKRFIEAGIEKLDDLLPFTADEVRGIHGIGPKAVESARSVLASYELAFAGEEVA